MKNSTKGFIIPILIGIIVLLIIACGIYVYQTKKVEAPVVVSTNMPVVLDANKLVTNQISGISVKVPKSTDVIINGDNSTEIKFGPNYYSSLGFFYSNN